MPRITWPSESTYLQKIAMQAPLRGPSRSILEKISTIYAELGQQHSVTALFAQEIEFRTRRRPFFGLRNGIIDPTTGLTCGEYYDELCELYARRYKIDPFNIQGYKGNPGNMDDVSATFVLANFITHESRCSSLLQPATKQKHLRDNANAEIRLAPKEPIQSISAYYKVFLELTKIAEQCGLPLSAPRSVHNNFSFWRGGENIFSLKSEADQTCRMIDGILCYLSAGQTELLKESRVSLTPYGEKQAREGLVRLAVNRMTELRYSDERIETRGFPEGDQNIIAFPAVDIEIYLILLGACYGLNNVNSSTSLCSIVSCPKFTTAGFPELAGILANSYLNEDGSLSIDAAYVKKNMQWNTTRRELEKLGLYGIQAEVLAADICKTRIIDNQILWSGVFSNVSGQINITCTGKTRKIVGSVTKADLARFNDIPEIPWSGLAPT